MNAASPTTAIGTWPGRPSDAMCCCPLTLPDASPAALAQPARKERESPRRDRHAIRARLVRPGDNGGALEQVQRDLGDRALGWFGEEAAGGPPVERAYRGP